MLRFLFYLSHFIKPNVRCFVVSVSSLSNTGCGFYKEVSLELMWTFNLTSEGPLLRYYICDDGLSDSGGIDV